MLGYQQYKNILLDVLDLLDSSISQSIVTNAPPRVETIVQEFTTNTPLHLKWSESDGMIVHLINLTGYSNSYFEPLAVENTTFQLKCDFRPSSLQTMKGGKQIDFTWGDGTLRFTIPHLWDYEGIIVFR
jgi:hypothetical protein